MMEEEGGWFDYACKRVVLCCSHPRWMVYFCFLVIAFRFLKT